MIASRFCLGFMAVHLWTAPVLAQDFRIVGSGGNTFGFPPPECQFNITDNQPLSDQRSCSGAANSCGSATWDQFTDVDRGRIECYRHAEGVFSCTLGTENNGEAQLVNNTAPDLIITGPPEPTQISAVFRVDVEGTTQTSPDVGFAFASFSPYARIFNVTLQPDCGTTCTDLTGRLSSAPANFPVNTPLTYEFYMTANTGIRGPGTPSATAQLLMRLPVGEPVFLLPEGYTVNCPTLNIVDNFWVGEVPCPGDVDGDDVINLNDLAIVLAHFGTLSGATRSDGDLDGDGDVDLADLTILLGNFGVPCP